MYPAHQAADCKMEAARSGQTRPTTIGFRATMRVFARGILSPSANHAVEHEATERTEECASQFLKSVRGAAHSPLTPALSHRRGRIIGRAVEIARSFA